eukprot:8915104-Pyramimonas_sp.AAC.1
MISDPSLPSIQLRCLPLYPRSRVIADLELPKIPHRILSNQAKGNRVHRRRTRRRRRKGGRGGG